MGTGSPEPLGFDEPDPHSVLLAEWEAGKWRVEPVDVSQMRYRTTSLDVSAFASSAELEARIRELEAKLRNVELIEDQDRTGSGVAVGSRVRLEELNTGDLIDYHHSGSAEACQKLVEQALFKPGFLAQREQRIREEFRTTSWTSCANAVLRLVFEHAIHVKAEASHAA